MRRRTALLTPAAGARWRCCLCKDWGTATTDQDALDAFEAHYAAKHLQPCNAKR